MRLSKEAGKQLVKLARKAIESAFGEAEVEIPASLQKILSETSGAFVTLKKHGELRGCIGFPAPVFPLGVALLRAAKAAAFDDTRFSPLEESELKEIKIEISVLTKPEELKCKPSERHKKIKVGRDGLIVEGQGTSGLLLPQVPVEWNWSTEEFLKQTCVKAGMEPELWNSDKIKFYTFQALIFSSVCRLTLQGF